MPIRELTRYRATCSTCGAIEDFEATDTTHRSVPAGWTAQREPEQNYWNRPIWCPACSEQREERGDE